MMICRSLFWGGSVHDGMVFTNIFQPGKDCLRELIRVLPNLRTLDFRDQRLGVKCGHILGGARFGAWQHYLSGSIP